ncbi:MAG: cyanoexosortase A [Plectolyngbya sp. WJT66-NPBG17]|jgi:cyanoexosortase A|nr:cyanoexosortase A [Plectolyngbya sp. WJT66-NPBG17]
MKLVLSSPTQLLRIPKYWLLAIGAGLMAIHLSLVWRSNLPEFQGNCFVFWAAAVSLVWQKRDDFEFKSSFAASLLGSALIAIALLRIHILPDFGLFLRLFPLITGLGLALLATGFKHLRHYWHEFAVFILLAIPPTALSFFEISPITARFSTLLLWLSGFEVQRQGVYIMLSTGASIEVYHGCSGVIVIIQVLKFVGLAFLLFPTNWIQRIVLPIVGIVIAFFTNAIRVMILAILSAPGSGEAFTYWHDGSGSLAFSMLAVSIVGALCYFWLLRDEDIERISEEGEEW